MNDIAKRLNTYIKSHPFDSGNTNCETVLEQLYQAYIESHDTDPPEISNGFKELEQFLRTLPLADNDAVFNLCDDDLCALECLDAVPASADADDDLDHARL